MTFAGKEGAIIMENKRIKEPLQYCSQL